MELLDLQKRILKLTWDLANQEMALNALPRCVARDSIEAGYNPNLRAWEELISEFFLLDRLGCPYGIKERCEEPLKGYTPCFVECFFRVRT